MSEVSKQQIKIVVVAETLCPLCEGGDEFFNRPKVGDEDGSWWWRCYNPDCEVDYYNPTKRLYDDKKGKTHRYPGE